MEQWLDIKGYEGYYQVSNYGNVRSLPRQRTKGVILKPNIRNGYESVILCSDGNVKNVSVHRLVATAFIENKNKFDIVNHIDENKLNNNANNLEWCTQSQNLNLSTRNKSKAKKVCQYSLKGKLIKVWESPTQAKELGGYDDSNIRKCCIGTRSKHKGFKWAYV